MKARRRGMAVDIADMPLRVTESPLGLLADAWRLSRGSAVSPRQDNARGLENIHTQSSIAIWHQMHSPHLQPADRILCTRMTGRNTRNAMRLIRCRLKKPVSSCHENNPQ